MNERPKERIGFLVAWFMFSVAVLVDAVQILLNLTVFLSPVAAFIGIVFNIIFFGWFKLLGVEYLGGQGGWVKSLIMAGMVAIGAIPEVDIVPEFIVGVGSLIVMIRTEDKAKIKKWEQSYAAQLQNQRRQAAMVRRQQEIEYQNAVSETA